ncbi:MAG: transposase domain-containing protein [Pseudomonadota bacterium]
MRVQPEKLWWTADELAAAKLPDLPGSKRGINYKAETFGWQQIPGCARRKAGRGGGWQYHWSVLPSAAQKALLSAKQAAPNAPMGRDLAWDQYAQLSQKAKDIAKARLEGLQHLELLVAAGTTHVAAASEVGRLNGVSVRTVYNWLNMIAGVEAADRLAYLAPKHQIAERKSQPDRAVRPFMDRLKSQYLQLAGQTFRKCYRDAVKKAKAEGWPILEEKTAKRRLEKEVPRVAIVFAREGVLGLERCFPAQIRDRSSLGALGAVSADCHKFDVFVQWPDGTINRPQMVAFQDLYSNKLLSWRVDHTPNKVMVMSAFGELVERWGIPRKCQFDNGREFANKWMTGGTPTRFRFKVREDEALGVLPMMGIDIHWASPGRGQSKPIERAFRDLASDVAKDPRFHGAYVGNRPDAKPENYGSRAIPIDTFLKVLDGGIEEFNARDGRLTDVAAGRSFDEAFEESFATSVIRKATDEQRRLWLMGQHECKLNRQNGSIKFQSNVYHSYWMSDHPKREVVARFDPEDLHSGLHVYDIDGTYLGFAECQQKIGFFDLASAQKQARKTARIKRAQKQLLKAQRPLSISKISADLDAIAPGSEEDLVAKVVAPEFGRKSASVEMKPLRYHSVDDPAVTAEHEAIICELSARLEAKATPQEDANARFLRFQAIKDRADGGERIGTEEARKLRSYMETAEYQALILIYEEHGRAGLGG